jgi:hypothetical protein
MTLRILCLGLLSAGLLRAATVSSTRSETHPLAPGGRVAIENTNGSITVNGWDRPEAALTIVKRAPTQEALDATVAVIESHPGSLSVRIIPPAHASGWGRLASLFRGSGPETEVSIEISVPAGATSASVSLVNGSVAIGGVRGPLNVSTVNGGIRATAVEGGEFSTTNGPVHVSVSRLDPKAGLSISTVNGGVTVQLPEKTGAEVELSTVNGRCVSDFSLVGGRRGMSGSIGAGGAPVHVGTVNGSVQLLRVPAAAALLDRPASPARVARLAALDARETAAGAPCRRVTPPVDPL